MSVIDKPWGRILVDEATGETTHIIKSRRLFVIDDDFSLEPDSLVGSHFHAIEPDTREIVWQGIVVGEPQPAVYVLEFENCQTGATRCQKVMSLAQLTQGALASTPSVAEGRLVDGVEFEWRWYDSAEEMARAYVEYTMAVTRENARTDG
jgi:hypothetical protein